jgi:hypothetical protein
MLPCEDDEQFLDLSKTSIAIGVRLFGTDCWLFGRKIELVDSPRNNHCH